MNSDATEATGIRCLTEREAAVLELIATGATNVVIAERLHLSVRTVEAHVSEIFRGLGLSPTVTNRRVLAAVRYVQALSLREAAVILTTWCSEPIQGRVQSSVGGPVEFSGWVGLVAAIQEMRSCAVRASSCPAAMP